MDLQFENVLGRRASVVVTGGEVLVVETTPGNFKVGGELSAKLGITDGDALAVQKAGETFYIGKGKNGVAKKDENGKDLTDDRGRIVYEENQEPFGAIVRDINEGGAYQRFSSSAMWAGLGGNNDTKRVFTLGEGVDVSLETPSGTHTTTLYPLVFDKEEAKVIRRKKSDEGAEATEDAQTVDAGNTAVTAEDAQTSNGFSAPSFEDEEL